MTQSRDIGVEGTFFEWEKVYAAHNISPESRLVDVRARVHEPVLSNMLLASIEGHILAGAPKTVTAYVVAPKNLWAYLKRALGFRSYETTTISNTKIVNRRLCPHGTVDRQGAHLRWLSLDIPEDE